MLGYVKDIHLTDGHDKHLPPIFGKVLQFSIMLPLVDCTPEHINPAAMFERFWNSSFSNFLLKNDYLLGNQNIQSEYRIVKNLTDHDFEKIKAFGDEVTETIIKISALLK